MTNFLLLTSSISNRYIACMRARGVFAVLASVIGHSLSAMDCKTQLRIEWKFELCFVLAK